MLKMIIVDAGGVLQPDSKLGLACQAELHTLTGLAPTLLDELQDHDKLNGGAMPLSKLFEEIALMSLTKPKPTVEQLLESYLDGISHYQESIDMLRHLVAMDYKVVLLTNNSDVGVLHTKNLLMQAGLPMITVYGSAEIGISKPNPEAFLHVCRTEKVDPQDCLFIDDCERNRLVAKELGMSTIAFERPEDSSAALQSVNQCMDQLIKLEVIRATTFNFLDLPYNIDRGKYPV